MTDRSDRAAQRIPDELVAEVKARTDLRKLVGARMKLVRGGRDYKGLCPFHAEKTPSFHVYADHYHCFGCGAHGGAIDFVMETERRAFRDVVEDLAALAGVVIPGATERPRRAEPAPLVGPAYDPEEVRRKKEGERRKAYDMWRTRKPLAGSVAETYLCEARGIRRQAVADCSALGFLPEASYWVPGPDEKAPPVCLGAWPALAAVMVSAAGRFAALHLTYLERDGSDKLRLADAASEKRRTAKKVRGSPVGALIRLTPARAWTLAGEGIETTLTGVDALSGAVGGMVAYSLDNLAGPGLGDGEIDPRDATKRLPSRFPDMSRTGIEFPAGVRKATFLGDGDTKDRLMLECKLDRAVRRQRELGLTAEWVMSDPGMDFNDYLKRAVDGG